MKCSLISMRWECYPYFKTNKGYIDRYVKCSVPKQFFTFRFVKKRFATNDGDVWLVVWDLGHVWDFGHVWSLNWRCCRRWDLKKINPNKCNICSGLVSNKNFVRKFKVLIRAPFRGTFRAKYRYRDQTKVRPMCCWQVNPYQMNSCRRIEEIRLDFGSKDLETFSELWDVTRWENNVRSEMQIYTFY